MVSSREIELLGPVSRVVRLRCLASEDFSDSLRGVLLGNSLAGYASVSLIHAK